MFKISLFILCTFAQQSLAQQRLWHNPDETKSFSALFLSADSNKVTVLKNGRKVTFGLDRASKTARDWVPQKQAATEPTETQKKEEPQLEATDPKEKNNHIVLENGHIYTVSMETSLVIPKNLEIDQLRVWHALPTKRPWQNAETLYGASKESSSANGKLQHNKEKEAYYHFWKVSGLQKAGSHHNFKSSFTVHSFDRNFDYKKSKVQWLDFQKEKLQAPASPVADVEPEIEKAAAKIIKRHKPAEAIVEFSKWVQKNIKYDASFQHDSIASILKEGKGHCGQQAQVFQAFCNYAKIPYRTVFGLNLYAPDGKGKLHKIRKDYSNIHTWGEVYFPGHGWIEVEPAMGTDVYLLKHRMIQNNRWFQNYSIWTRENGSDKPIPWKYEKGKYSSDYDLEHIIRFW